MSKYPTNTAIPLFETFCRKNQVDGKLITVEVNGKPINVKVATTPKSQEKGYMGAELEPGEDEGILFVYDREEPLSFWMKNVPFGLDIIFFDSNMEYIDHQSMDQFDGSPDHKLPRYTSKKPARFAVEVPHGWCDRNLDGACKLKF